MSVREPALHARFWGHQVSIGLCRLLREAAFLCALQMGARRYGSGKGDWVKAKTKAWREANKYRGEMFNAR